MKRPRHHIARALIALACVLAVASTCSCAPRSGQNDRPGPRLPSPWDGSTPQSAVRSYLEWTSYALLVADSTVATQTMSPAEEVRVDSYVQLNKQAGKVIDQRLLSLTLGEPSTQGTRTVVATHESWEYSYVGIDTRKSLTPTYTVSYDATYTVVSPRPGAWVVDSVDARPLGEVK